MRTKNILKFSRTKSKHFRFYKNEKHILAKKKSLKISDILVFRYNINHIFFYLPP